MARKERGPKTSPGFGTSVAVPFEIVPRLDGLRIIPSEPRWRVIERLLDSYDLLHPKVAPQAAQEAPA